ncbi:MAG: hypothetical protein Q4B96_01520 [Bacillota bacterium]|nr:hypothetical protein [Bacillota bacterium]
MSEIKRSLKSKMKKRNADWEAEKVEIAKELGLWPEVERDGWSGLSAADSGRIGGVLAARRKAAGMAAINRAQLTGALLPDGGAELGLGDIGPDVIGLNTDGTIVEE